MKNTYTFEELINRLPDVLVSALKNSMQDPIWHPEGSVYTHTKMVFEYAQKNFPGNDDLLVCAIFHDLGKPETQTIKARDKSFKGDPLTLPWKKQKISNLYHDVKAKNYIEKYFYLFNDVSVNKEKVLEICDNHLRAHIYLSGEMKKPFKRNKIETLRYFSELLQFEECDTNGKSVTDNKFKDVKSEKDFLIILSNHVFFAEDYNYISNEQHKISFKNQIMKYLRSIFDNYGNVDPLLVVEETGFYDFVNELIKKYRIDRDKDTEIVNFIYAHLKNMLRKY